MKALSLFSSAGVGTTYLKDIGIKIVVANELNKRRAKLHQQCYPNTKVIQGSILEDDINVQIQEALKGHTIDLIVATPPCQGVSKQGKNQCDKSRTQDSRNYLIFEVIKYIHLLKPSFVLIENVPPYKNLLLNYNDLVYTVEDILSLEFGEEYEIKSEILNCADYNIPQSRKRYFIKLFKKGLVWNSPIKSDKQISIKEAIDYLPTLEAGETSDIKWHYARNQSKNHIECMKHTKSGETALNNKDKYYPRTLKGDRVIRFGSGFRRLNPNKPCSTITTKTRSLNSGLNHYGRLKEDGTYSDARPLTPLELMVINSLPKNWNIPDDTPDSLIADVLGECVPPLIIKRLCEPIFENEKFTEL